MVLRLFLEVRKKGMANEESSKPHSNAQSITKRLIFEGVRPTCDDMFSEHGYMIGLTELEHEFPFFISFSNGSSDVYTSQNNLEGRPNNLIMPNHSLDSQHMRLDQNSIQSLRQKRFLGVTNSHSTNPHAQSRAVPQDKKVPSFRRSCQSQHPFPRVIC